MEYNINIIELIGIIIGSIATILGGVWFMLYKAFGLGKASQRMEEIEKKTSNANCDVNRESIEKIKEQNLPQRIEQIEKKTIHAACEINRENIEKIKEQNLPQRIEQIEKKTIHAACEINRENIEKIKEQNLPKRIEQIEKKTIQADCKSNSDLIRQHQITFNSIKLHIDKANTIFDSLNKKFSDIDKRFADIDKKFSDIDKNFIEVNNSINNLTKEVSSIKSFLSTKYNEKIDLVGLKNSPTKLTDFGNQILEEIDGIKFINENKEQLISRLEEEKPRTALDVEYSALIVFVNFCQSEKFDGIKNFIYNSPEYTVKDKNGRYVKHNLSLMNVCFILSIPLRDMYLKIHPEILNNV